MKTLEQLGNACKQASRQIMNADRNQKDALLRAIAKQLEQDMPAILKANALDVENGKANGMNAGLLDRMLLNEARMQQIIEGVYQVCALPDPIGEITDMHTTENGLQIGTMRVALGVVGMIYEARPNVTVDAAVLSLKAGNAVMLRGSKDILQSNLVIVSSMRRAAAACGFCADIITLLEDTSRETASAMMRMNEYLDVLIPRGGAGLIRSVVENSTIPVIETGTGNCHVYVDKDADVDMAVKILMNAKTQRIGVCNACESLVVHRAVRDKFLPKMAEALNTKNVELRGDESTREILPDCIPATEEDYGTEYLDYILSVKTVDSVEEAIAHINRYNTKHSECIVTENTETAEKFLNEVDAACVYVNASTRFTDGFEFGFGAEIGISTQKLHARGPMGLKELTSYKYKIHGNGQIRR